MPIDWSVMLDKGLKGLTTALFFALLLAIYNGWKARKRREAARLTTPLSRLGLFLQWITVALSLALAFVSWLPFLMFDGPPNSNMWFLATVGSGVALAIWLLGRGLFYVFAGSPAPSTEAHVRVPEVSNYAQRIASLEARLDSVETTLSLERAPSSGPWERQSG